MAIDLEFNETQTLIQNTARELFERRHPLSAVREAEASAEGFSRDLWLEMCELGWAGTTIPEAYGGSGLGFLDAYPLYLEMGRCLVTSPHLESSIVAADTLLALGSEEQKRAVLPGIASGEGVVIPAALEPEGLYGPEGITTEARREGDAYVLHGSKALVAFVDAARTLLVAARTGGERGADGVSLFLVEAGASGLSSERLQNIGGYPLSLVRFDGVRVPTGARVGAEGRGWGALDAAMTRAAVLQAAMIAGAGERVLDMSANYARDRVQFGSPIGRHQAVQYMVTDVLIDAHLSRLLALHAAWLIHGGLPFAREAALAKAAASRASAHLMRQAHELHAGIGFMVDYDLQLFSRRAKHWEWNLGDARYQAERMLEAAGV